MEIRRPAFSETSPINQSRRIKVILAFLVSFVVSLILALIIEALKPDENAPT